MAARKGRAKLSVVKSSGNVLLDHGHGSHAVVLWHDFHPPAAILERLSRDLRTEVIWLAFLKQVDAFGYEEAAELRAIWKERRLTA